MAVAAERSRESKTQRGRLREEEKRGPTNPSLVGYIAGNTASQFRDLMSVNLNVVGDGASIYGAALERLNI